MSPAMPEWTYVVADWLPLFVLLALAMTALVTWLLAGDRARRLADIVRRQDELIAVLEKQLTEAESIVNSLTSGTDQIIAAARGAHHKPEETPDE